jgi:mRNA interferase RelE/StbE
MSYSIRYSGEAEKALPKLDKAVQIQILKKISHLPENPELGEPLSNVLRNKWRLHIGKWRVVYSIEGNAVLIAKIEHRKGVYR